MVIVGGQIGYWLLRKVGTQGRSTHHGEGLDAVDTNLEQTFGEGFFDMTRGKTVLDFGCGAGAQAVEMARMGAVRVIGLEYSRTGWLRPCNLRGSIQCQTDASSSQH